MLDSKKDREIQYDCLRILACFMVILLHVSAKNWYIVEPKTYQWNIMNAIDTFSRSAVPIFFMISGALLLKKEILILKLYKKNICNLVVIYIVWSVLYAVDQLGINEFYKDVGALGSAIVNSYYHLWFIPAMVSVYILLPILFAIVSYKDGKYIKYYLCIFFAFVICRNTMLNIPSLPQNLGTVLRKISLESMQYSGYFVLGYYLSQKVYEKVKSFVYISLFVVTALCATVIEAIVSIARGEATGFLYDDFSLPVFIEAIALFLLFQEVKKMVFTQKFRRGIIFFSEATLAIYLLHPFVYEHLNIIWGLNSLSFNPLLSIPIISICTFFICVVCYFILRKIPIIKNIV